MIERRALTVTDQNAASEITRLRRLPDGGVFANLLDGIAREETYTPMVEKSVASELLAWLPEGRSGLVVQLRASEIDRPVEATRD